MSWAFYWLYVTRDHKNVNSLCQRQWLKWQTTHLRIETGILLGDKRLINMHDVYSA